MEIRSAQQHTVDTVSNTGIAVITDMGMQLDELNTDFCQQMQKETVSLYRKSPFGLICLRR